MNLPGLGGPRKPIKGRGHAQGVGGDGHHITKDHAMEKETVTAISRMKEANRKNFQISIRRKKRARVVQKGNSKETNGGNGKSGQTL